MKNLLCLVLILCSIQLSADPWNAMTEKNANAAMEYLKQNPYIIDFCDCCDADGEYAAEVYLVKVLRTYLTKSKWSKGKYKVMMEVRRIAKIPYYEANGSEPENAVKAEEKVETIDLTMNYTRGFSRTSKMADHFHKLVEYEHFNDNELRNCREAIAYPNPFEAGCKFYDRDYMEWYRLNFK